MTAAEGMKDIRHAEFNLRHLAWFEWFRFLEAVPELPAKNVSPHELLIPTHGHVGRIGGRVGEVTGVNVDEFYHPICVRARRRNVKGSVKRPGEGQILLERFCLIY